MFAGDPDELQPLAQEAADEGDPRLEVVRARERLLVLSASSGRNG